MLAGMFGMGAGWANVPVLNLLMGAPLKVAAGTSSFILSLVDSAAAWVYLIEGAVLTVIAVPSVIGMMIGARIGARLLTVLKASVVRKLVLALLLFAGAARAAEGPRDLELRTQRCRNTNPPIPCRSSNCFMHGCSTSRRSSAS